MFVERLIEKIINEYLEIVSLNFTRGKISLCLAVFHFSFLIQQFHSSLKNLLNLF